MNPEKKARLTHSGWTVGDAAGFLDLTSEQSQFVEMKLALAAGVRKLREKRGLTQTELALELGSSQSRVAKMEAGHRSVSIDLLVRSLLAIGADPGEIAKMIKRADSKRAA